MTNVRVALSLAVVVGDEWTPQIPRSATPDFLLILVALANFMRLSLMKAAHVDLGECSVAGNPLRFG
jgi:hypothetical protein